MDKPPAHHPDCDCVLDEIDGRVVSASNTIIEFATDVAAGHQLCSYNMLVVAYFLLEFVQEKSDTERDTDIDTKARETAKKFYDYSSAQWDSSKKRKLN